MNPILRWYLGRRKAVDEAGPFAPTVTSVSVPAGDAAGGVACTLTGTGFIDGCEVYFGNNIATSIVVVSPTRIDCLTPAAGSIPGLGVVDVVVTQASGVGTLAGGYFQRCERSVETDGAAEHLRDLTVTPPANGALSIGGLIYRPAGASGRLFTVRNAANTEIIRFGYGASGKVNMRIDSGGSTRFDRDSAAGAFDEGTWAVVLGSRDVAGAWVLTIAELGGGVTSSAASAWNGVPAFDRVYVLGDTSLYTAGSCAFFGVWEGRNIATDGGLAAWIASDKWQAFPGHPANPGTLPRNAFLPALGGTIAAGFADKGSATGGDAWDMQAQAMETGDLKTGAGAWPGV